MLCLGCAGMQVDMQRLPTPRLRLQVTKVPRAAAALVLAPVVDRLMAWLQRVTKLESRRQVGGGRRVGASGGAAAHPAPSGQAHQTLPLLALRRCSAGLWPAAWAWRSRCSAWSCWRGREPTAATVGAKMLGVEK